MGQARWILNRVAAALAGAALVGVLAAVVGGVFNAVTCRPPCTALGPELWSLAFILVCSLTFGTLPGIAALTLTPARKRPWRSLPLLVLGTLVGFTIWLSVVLHFSLQNDPRSLLFLLLFPTLTGLATAFNIDRLTPRRARAPM